MSDVPARDKAPHHANVLGRYLTDAAKTSGVPAGRLRHWLGFMVIAAMLSNARDTTDGRAMFLTKGGVAMELRVGGSARATKDLDTAIRAAIGDLADHLDPALRAGFGDFTATRTEIQAIHNTGACRCVIKVQYRGQSPVLDPALLNTVDALLDRFRVGSAPSSWCSSGSLHAQAGSMGNSHGSSC